MTLLRWTWMTKFERGELVLVKVTERGFTLAAPAHGKVGCLREYPHTEGRRKDPYAPAYSLGHQMALITNIIPNKLEQPLVYELLCDSQTYSCTSLLASKYLIKIS